jgi:pyruvate formate lyase activating enzyme
MDKNHGLVSQIVHGSFVDGYGIRTTVFLKGCPLRCLWCCNPETQQGYPEISFTHSKCNGCRNCIQQCPVNAIKIDPSSETGAILINRDRCTNCGECINKCFTEALEFFGRYYSVDELFEVIIKDRQFYQSSGGGVTIGGGEPTFQPSFTLAFLKKCRDNYVHTAIDTCGYTYTDVGMDILKQADLLLYDLKNMDREQHHNITGGSNEIILSNLQMLDSLGKEIIVRIPFIPEHTDSQENIERTAEFLSGLKSIIRVDIIMFHKGGVIKYEKLGKPYRLDNLQPLSDQRGDEVKQIFRRHGITVQLGG